MSDFIKPRTKEGYCGPATLAWAMQEQGLPYPDQDELAARMIEPGWGTPGYALQKEAERQGLVAEWIQTDLNGLVILQEYGWSVIVSYMSGPNEQDDGHYAVVKTITTELVALQNPEWVGRIDIYPRDRFEAIWYDFDEDGNKLENWAMIVKNPNEGK